MRNKHCLVLQFYVLDGPEFRNKPPLMCGTDCELLNIVRMNVDEIHSIHATPSIHKAYVKRTYSDVFSGLGCIGDPLHMELNIKVRPVQSGDIQ